MNNFNLEREWNFIINEIHSRRFKKTNLIKKETLFAMEVLLCKLMIKTYLTLKRIYCEEKIN